MLDARKTIAGARVFDTQLRTQFGLGKILMNDVTPLSESLSGSIDKLYKTGGLQLVFLFLGTVLLLFSATIDLKDIVRYGVAFIGFLLLLSCMIYFFLAHIRPVGKLKDELKSKAALIDATHLTALEIVQTSDVIQELTLANASKIANLLKEYGPIIRKLPLVGDKLAAFIEKNENLSVEIVKFSIGAKEITQNIERALKESDLSALQGYIKDLQSMRVSIEKFKSRSAL